MADNQSIQIVHVFAAAPQAVFDAFTTPDGLRAWWLGQTTFAIDLRVGGKWVITRQDGNETSVTQGEYIAIDAPRHLKFSYQMPQITANTDIITVDLEPDAGVGTKMTFTQSGPDIASDLAVLPQGAITISEAVWRQGFDLIDKALQPPQPIPQG